jgi:hypothetical protein
MHAENFLSALDELSPGAAERWVVAVLAEEAALREHDDRLYPADRDAVAMAVAQRLHAAWGRWADDAQTLLDRLRASRNGGQSVQKSDELEKALARARATLKLTPERMNQRRAQARQGDALTPEEVRRELGLSGRR